MTNLKKNRFRNHFFSTVEPEKLTGSQGSPNSDCDCGLVNHLGPSQHEEAGLREELRAGRKGELSVDCSPVVLSTGDLILREVEQEETVFQMKPVVVVVGGECGLKGFGTESVEVFVIKSCLALCNPTDCSPPGSSAHGVLQARILEWVAMPFFGDLPNPGIEPGTPALQTDSLPSEPPGKKGAIKKNQLKEHLEAQPE